MKCVKPAEMERVFDKLKVVGRSSTHHRPAFIVDRDGKKLFPPLFFSKGKSEIGPAVTDAIRKSLLLRKDEFGTLVRCRMSRDEYLEIRKSR